MSTQPRTPAASTPASSRSGDDDAPRARRSDREVRAEDQARVGVDGDGEGREQRAVGGGVRVDRRARHGDDVKRAESRGRYRDPVTDAIRIVGAGDVIPDGWDRVEGASLSDRGVEGARSAHASGEVIGSKQGGPPEATA